MAEEIVVTDAQVRAAQMIVDHDKAVGRETDESIRKIAEAKPQGNRRERLAAEVKQRYEAGGSIRSIAASLGLSYGFVHRVLTEQGVALRGGAETDLPDSTRGRFGKR